LELGGPENGEDSLLSDEKGVKADASISQENIDFGKKDHRRHSRGRGTDHSLHINRSKSMSSELLTHANLKQRRLSKSASKMMGD